MNKKAQHVLIGLMIAFMGVIFVIGTLPSLKSIVIDARAVGNLDCTNASITDGTKATCVAVDYSPFGFALFGIGLSIASIGGWLVYRRK